MTDVKVFAMLCLQAFKMYRGVVGANIQTDVNIIGAETVMKYEIFQLALYYALT